MRQEVYICDICCNQIQEREYAEYYNGDQREKYLVSNIIALRPCPGKHICERCLDEMNEALVRAMLVKQEDSP